MIALGANQKVEISLVPASVEEVNSKVDDVDWNRVNIRREFMYEAFEDF